MSHFLSDFVIFFYTASVLRLNNCLYTINISFESAEILFDQDKKYYLDESKNLCSVPSAYVSNCKSPEPPPVIVPSSNST